MLRVTPVVDTPDGDKYAHYYFYETCNDDAVSVLMLVEKMFAEIAALPYGNVAFIRARPTIEHQKKFDGGRQAVVYFRFALKVAPKPEEPQVTLWGSGAPPV